MRADTRFCPGMAFPPGGSTWIRSGRSRIDTSAASTAPPGSERQQAQPGLGRDDCASLAPFDKPATQHVGAADELGDESAGRALVYFGRSADLLDPAVRQDGNAVRQGQSLGLVVRNVDRGLAKPALQIAQLLAHLNPQLEVEVGQRLVEHQDARFEHQRAGDRHTLLLTRGKLRRKSGRHPDEIDKLQHAADPVGDRRFAEPAQTQPERDVVEHRQMRKQCVILENKADVAAVRRLLVKPLTMQAD